MKNITHSNLNSDLKSIQENNKSFDKRQRKSVSPNLQIKLDMTDPLIQREDKIKELEITDIDIQRILRNALNEEVKTQIQIPSDCKWNHENISSKLYKYKSLQDVFSYLKERIQEAVQKEIQKAKLINGQDYIEALVENKYHQQEAFKQAIKSQNEEAQQMLSYQARIGAKRGKTYKEEEEDERKKNEELKRKLAYEYKQGLGKIDNLIASYEYEADIVSDKIKEIEKESTINWNSDKFVNYDLLGNKLKKLLQKWKADDSNFNPNDFGLAQKKLWIEYQEFEKVIQQEQERADIDRKEMWTKAVQQVDFMKQRFQFQIEVIESALTETKIDSIMKIEQAQMASAELESRFGRYFIGDQVFLKADILTHDIQSNIKPYKKKQVFQKLKEFNELVIQINIQLKDLRKENQRLQEQISQLVSEKRDLQNEIQSTKRICEMYAETIDNIISNVLVLESYQKQDEVMRMLQRSDFMKHLEITTFFRLNPVSDHYNSLWQQHLKLKEKFKEVYQIACNHSDIKGLDQLIATVKEKAFREMAEIELPNKNQIIEKQQKEQKKLVRGESNIKQSMNIQNAKNRVLGGVRALVKSKVIGKEKQEPARKESVMSSNNSLITQSPGKSGSVGHLSSFHATPSQTNIVTQKVNNKRRGSVVIGKLSPKGQKQVKQKILSSPKEQNTDHDSIRIQFKYRDLISSLNPSMDITLDKSVYEEINQIIKNTGKKTNLKTDEFQLQPILDCLAKLIKSLGKQKAKHKKKIDLIDTVKIYTIDDKNIVFLPRNDVIKLWYTKLPKQHKYDIVGLVKMFFFINGHQSHAEDYILEKTKSQIKNEINMKIKEEKLKEEISPKSPMKSPVQSLTPSPGRFLSDPTGIISPEQKLLSANKKRFQEIFLAIQRIEGQIPDYQPLSSFDLPKLLQPPKSNQKESTNILIKSVSYLKQFDNFKRKIQDLEQKLDERQIEERLINNDSFFSKRQIAISRESSNSAAPSGAIKRIVHSHLSTQESQKKIKFKEKVIEEDSKVLAFDVDTLEEDNKISRDQMSKEQNSGIYTTGDKRISTAATSHKRANSVISKRQNSIICKQLVTNKKEKREKIEVEMKALKPQNIDIFQMPSTDFKSERSTPIQPKRFDQFDDKYNLKWFDKRKVELSTDAQQNAQKTIKLLDHYLVDAKKNIQIFKHKKEKRKLNFRFKPESQSQNHSRYNSPDQQQLYDSYLRRGMDSFNQGNANKSFELFSNQLRHPANKKQISHQIFVNTSRDKSNDEPTSPMFFQ